MTDPDILQDFVTAIKDRDEEAIRFFGLNMIEWSDDIQYTINITSTNTYPYKNIQDEWSPRKDSINNILNTRLLFTYNTTLWAGPAHQIKTEIVTPKDFDLPKSVDPDTIVLISSIYGGGLNQNIIFFTT